MPSEDLINIAATLARLDPLHGIDKDLVTRQTQDNLIRLALRVKTAADEKRELEVQLAKANAALRWLTIESTLEPGVKFYTGSTQVPVDLTHLVAVQRAHLEGRE